MLGRRSVGVGIDWIEERSVERVGERSVPRKERASEHRAGRLVVEHVLDDERLRGRPHERLGRSHVPPSDWRLELSDAEIEGVVQPGLAVETFDVDPRVRPDARLSALHVRQLRRFELREPPQERNRLEGDEESRPLEVSPALAAFEPLGVHDGEAADREPGIPEAEAAPGVVVDPAESRVEVEDLRPGSLGRALGRGGRAGRDDEEPREQRGAGGPAPGPAPFMGAAFRVRIAHDEVDGRSSRCARVSFFDSDVNSHAARHFWHARQHGDRSGKWPANRSSRGRADRPDDSRLLLPRDCRFLQKPAGTGRVGGPTLQLRIARGNVRSVGMRDLRLLDACRRTRLC